MAKLVCQAGPNAGHEYPLTADKLLFGRQATCDVQILDSMASREHFVVRRDGNLYTLVDLESRNGTHLNNRKVTERQLEFGDVIRVGTVEYLFVRESGDADIKDLLTHKYRIIDKIGEGGMGIVYKAVQKSMDRTVALKVLAPKYSARQRFIEQFIREARAAGALNHPNIIQVHDVGTESDIHYFSMEFVDGPTCMAMIRRQGPLPVPVALEIVRQTAKALDYAHDNHLIHRDIKPDNIMVTANNTVKLADLGISKTFEEVEAEGKPKRIVGTPHYMAPEAALGKQIDHRVDLYSLGATLYQLLSGKTPYKGATATEVLKGHISEPIPRLDHLPGRMADQIQAFLERLLAKKPDDRFQTAAEVVAEAQSLLGATGGSTSQRVGQETVLLRRLVSDTKQAPPEPEPVADEPSTGAVSTSASATQQRPRREPRGVSTSAVRMVLTLIIAALGLVIAWQVLDWAQRRLSLDQDPLPVIRPSPDPTPTQQLPPPDTDPPPGNAAPPRDADIAIANEFALLEQRAAEETDPAGLALIVERLATLHDEANDEALGQRIERLAGILRSRRDQALGEADRERFALVERDVNGLLRAHDYDNAAARLAAFEAGDSSGLTATVTRLAERIADEKERFLAQLRQRIDQIAARRDVARLRELYHDIPQPLIESDLAKDLGLRIQELEQQQLAAQREIFDRCRGQVANWDLAGFDAELDQDGHRIVDPALAARLDELRSLVDDLRRLLADLDEALAGRPKALRWRGVLHGTEDPDLVGADERGLRMALAEGSMATAPWTTLEGDTIRKVADLAGVEGAGDLLERLADVASGD